MGPAIIPTIDLSPFFKENDEDGKKKAMEMLSQACSEYGFFKIMNHGVPLELLHRALELAKKFFDHSPEEKLKCAAVPGAVVPAGYNIRPESSPEKNERVIVFSPAAGNNVYPADPPEFREVADELFDHLSKAALLVESIINECLGLPPNFLKEYDDSRFFDALSAMHYFPPSNQKNNGLAAHQDGNCITFVLQDEIGGLEVFKDGEWILVTPEEGTLAVNVGDVIQVLTNNKFKSVRHRVTCPEGRNRYSYVFFYSLHQDKWVEPLPEFTTKIGEPPQYRGFLYKDYFQLRIRDKINPPSRPEDAVTVNYYAITASN